MTIAETAEATGFSTYTLRYYEKVGVLQNITRDSSGHRNFSDQDVDILKFLNCLKKADMSIKEIRDFTDLLYSNESTLELRVELLEEQKSRVRTKLDDIQEAYNHIKWKIDYYNQQLGR